MNGKSKGRAVGRQKHHGRGTLFALPVYRTRFDVWTVWRGLPVPEYTPQVPFGHGVNTS